VDAGSPRLLSRASRFLRRDLMMAVSPDFFGNIKGSTDSEVMFHLALTFGPTDDPTGGLERMAGFVESVGAAAGIPAK
jgi:hypothetical protein